MKVGLALSNTVNDSNTSSGLGHRELIDKVEEPPKFSHRWLWTVLGPGAIIAALTIGSGELVWTPRAAVAFGYIMTWAFFYGIWIKAIIQWLANRWHVITGISASAATATTIGRWFNILMLAAILSVMPLWWNTLSTLSAQVPWVALGRPVSLTYFWIVIVILTIALLLSATRLGRAYGVLERVNQILLWTMFIAFWIAVLFAVRPDWIAFFSNLFIPRPIPEYEEWVKEAAPDIWALAPLVLLGSALGALGGGIQDYIGYQAMLKEKKWGFSGFSDQLTSKAIIEGKTKQLDLPTDEVSVRKINRWLRPTAFDTLLSFGMVFIVTMPVVILSVEILRPKHLAPSGIRFVEVQVAWLTETLGSWAGILWWLGAFAALWGTFYALHEVYTWTIYDLLRGTFKRFANITIDRVRLIVYGYVIIVGAIVYFTKFSLPILVAFATAVTHLFALAIWGIALLYLNLRVLPKPYRPSLIVVILSIIGIAVYLPYGILQLLLVFFPRLL
jgi:Mn2+/Fe2+ NRAMP family transporter